MNKIYLKLIAISLTLILSVSVVAMSSYAWLVLSGNPVASGIQVTIGGGNTILVAPDIVKVVDGVTYHIPGPFTDNMNFSRYTTYTYLNELEGLTPVSTADGVNWFLPEYYDFSDEEVRQGSVLAGQLKDVSDFYQDVELQHANIPSGNPDLSEKGSYYYLDFWVVSPGDNYTLRLSTGEDTGTFVMDLLEAQSAEGSSSYILGYPQNLGTAAVRVGFLANPHRITDDSMLHYQNSYFFDNRFTRLQGIYQEPNTGNAAIPGNRFTIYEPNADMHPYGAAEEGSYVQTQPVGYLNGAVQAVSVCDRLTVQRSCTWTPALTGVGTEIEQRFQAALLNLQTGDMELEEIQKAFYEEYLQWQLSPYVTKGKFIKNSASLDSFGSTITAADFAALTGAGATDDVYIIKLERNVPQRIRMFIWLEGQDVDCINQVNTSRFTISLELAGSNDELE